MLLAFGTDGIRGVANKELTSELSFALGRAAASVFGTNSAFLIGRDTRESGPSLQSALTAGLKAAGAEVVDLGVLPTPAIAYLSALRSAPAAVISASHNPYTDNGIKFFAPGGRKLSSETEAQIEAALHANFLADPFEMRVDGGQGTINSHLEDQTAGELYRQHLAKAVSGSDLRGMRVVIDCANGAASAVAPELFMTLGIDVTVLHASPDGKNINENCGSTHMESLQAVVVDQQADVGLAFDGDADRVLAVDEKGNLVDGDHIIAMLAIDAKQAGLLKDDTVVVTVMSNLGLRLAMERNQIAVHETAVGDRYVLEALNANGWSLGGEQSGHIVIPRLATTGDGLLTGLLLLALLKQSDCPLSELATRAMTQLPQVLRNVRVADRDALVNASEVWDAVRLAEQKLGHEGRVLLRASGTESLVRVMVEAPTSVQAQTVCDALSELVEQQLGSNS